ncbi:type II secretion system protein, partial [Candidatus Gracilibacteria bacterium]|nr:type II secretion system protein [Candidatus Gracilibacteria bacterium]
MYINKKYTTNMKAFTLVELIVVITILAILGTIAFLSFGSYTGGARDSKRVSDLKNIVSQVNTKNVAGITYINMISSGSYNLSSASIGGTGVTLGDDYLAGTPNYTVLGISATDFKDPLKTDTDYAIGATTRADGAFQVAATLENDNSPKALVSGTFKQRKQANIASGTVNGTSITLASGLGTFKTNDWIKDAVTASNSGRVTGVSSNLVTLTVSN